MFPEFWFDGNLYFGWITNDDDFKNLLESYKPYFNLDKILSAKLSSDNSYGFYSEYNGVKTLREFLDESRFDYERFRV